MCCTVQCDYITCVVFVIVVARGCILVVVVVVVLCIVFTDVGVYTTTFYIYTVVFRGVHNYT